MNEKTNEELIEEFENVEFNAGFAEGNKTPTASTPTERYLIKEEILKRMK